MGEVAGAEVHGGDGEGGRMRYVNLAPGRGVTHELGQVSVVVPREFRREFYSREGHD